jgi:hypothetical protein
VWTEKCVEPRWLKPNPDRALGTMSPLLRKRWCWMLRFSQLLSVSPNTAGAA